MTVTAIPALEDNYIWAYEIGSDVLIIDPSEAAPVLDYLQERAVNLAGVLLTHDHWDHVEGVPSLKEAFPGLKVYGPSETSGHNTQLVEPGDQLEILGQSFKVIPVPGHTEGHIAYLVNGHLFCGDSLFMAGCGRVFTGDYQAQYDTLMRLKALDDEVKVYAAHEYSQTNLRFAQGLAPDNEVITETLAQVNDLRAQGKPSLPSTIGLEKEINLFFQAETLEEFIDLRNQRDHF